MDSLSTSKARTLHKIFSQKHEDLNIQLQNALKWATKELGMELGIISHITDETYTIRDFWPPSDALHIDQKFELQNTYCSLAIQKEDVFFVEHMGESDYREHQCYKAFQLESYIGKPFHIEAAMYGTVNFSSSQPKAQEFVEDDALFVRLLSGWVSATIHRIDIENQLKDEHRLYKLISTNSAEMICMHETDGTYTYVSPAVKTLLGYSPRELVGTNPYHLFHPQDLERIAAESHEPANKGDARPTVEYRIKRKDGNYIWFDTATQPVTDDDGNVIALQTTSRDISEKKRLELLLSESQKMTNVGGWEFNLQTGELFWTEEVYRIHDLDVNETIDVERALSFYPDESRQLVQDAMAEVQSTGESRDLEVPFVTAKGKNIWVRVFLAAEFAGFEAIKLFGAFQDITEKKRLVELFSDAQEIAKVGGWEFDLETEELFWTDEVYRIHELEVGSEVDVAEAINFYPEGFSRDTINAALEHTQKTGDPYDVELPLITAKGNEIWVRAIGHAELIDGKAVKLQGTFQDITNRRKRQLQIEDQLNQLSDLKVTREKLYSIIAHDLKNSIFGITGLLELLIDDVNEGQLAEDELLMKLNLASLSADYSYKMLENMLTWVKLQSGLLKVTPHHFDLINSVETTVDLLNPAIARKKLKINTIVDTETEIVGEPNIITTVLRNLVNNAVKYSNAESSIDINISSSDERLISVAVTDHGVGMEKSILDNLFNQDVRPQKKGTQDEKGTGLGLLLVHDLIELHDGSIKVTSTPGKGSTFKFTIPRNISN